MRGCSELCVAGETELQVFFLSQSEIRDTCLKPASHASVVRKLYAREATFTRAPVFCLLPDQWGIPAARFFCLTR